MLYRILPIVILGLTATLTAAAIEYLPETLFFPVIEYGTSEAVQVAIYKSGEVDRGACEQSAGTVARAIRAQCPACTLVDRCSRGLDASHRQVLSRLPLATHSVRMPGGALTMLIAANDPAIALSVCRQIETLSAPQPVEKRLTCYPPGSARKS